MEQYAPAFQGVPRDIDPNDLLVFAAVAEQQSFSRAGERLGLPKSTVSRRLAALEQQLGEKLLLRTTRRQHLTEFGQLLLEHARQVGLEIEAVQALREQRQAVPSGRLRVSMPSDVAILLLSEPLAAFSSLYPAIRLEMDLSPRRVDLLGEGFDLAVRMGRLPDDASLVAKRLAVLPIGLYAAPDYLAQHGEPASPADLVQHAAVTILHSDSEPERWTLLRDGETWEGVAPSRASANSPELLMRLAVAGVGLTAVPHCFAQAEVRQGRLRRVLKAWCLPPHTAWAVFPERRLMPAKTRVFLNMLETALAPLSE